MTHPLHERDLVAAGRYVDRAMAADERTAFEDRMRSDPPLADAVRQAESLRGLFTAAAAEPAPAVRPGFGSRVLQRIASESGLEAELAGRVERRVVAVARWCLAAAAVIFAAAVLYSAGVLRPLDSGRLHADDETLIRQIDARIQAAGGLERR
jgi:anti-sigma-K factor RskA